MAKWTEDQFKNATTQELAIYFNQNIAKGESILQFLKACFENSITYDKFRKKIGKDYEICPESKKNNQLKYIVKKKKNQTKKSMEKKAVNTSEKRKKEENNLNLLARNFSTLKSKKAVISICLSKDLVDKLKEIENSTEEGKWGQLSKLSRSEIISIAVNEFLTQFE